MSPRLTRELALQARGLSDYERQPTLKSQIRHAAPGQTCHHWLNHRVTCDEYDDLRERAAGRCEICATPERETGGGRLVLDHYSGRGINIIRGVLCDRCNTSVMACMDGYKNWSEQLWRFREKALAYFANSWDVPTEEQWVAIAEEVRGRLVRRVYSPRVRPELRAKYGLVWPVGFVVAYHMAKAEENLETE